MSGWRDDLNDAPFPGWWSTMKLNPPSVKASPSGPAVTVLLSIILSVRVASPTETGLGLATPMSFVADLSQNMEGLAALGYSQDLRLANTLDLVEGKQGSQERWHIEHSFNGKMWIDIEEKGERSKWITLRALRVLKAAYQE